eukprot:Skav223131  [mRNA]  locus=scaffold470:99665:99883:- [translate_table: standard]
MTFSRAASSLSCGLTSSILVEGKAAITSLAHMKSCSSLLRFLIVASDSVSMSPLVIRQYPSPPKLSGLSIFM